MAITRLPARDHRRDHRAGRIGRGADCHRRGDSGDDAPGHRAAAPVFVDDVPGTEVPCGVSIGSVGSAALLPLIVANAGRPRRNVKKYTETSLKHTAIVAVVAGPLFL
jgi:hypothetical protein